MARVAEELGVSWNTSNDAVLAEGRRLLIADPARLECVHVVGVDEHAWRHTRKGDRWIPLVVANHGRPLNLDPSMKLGE